MSLTCHTIVFKLKSDIADISMEHFAVQNMTHGKVMNHLLELNNVVNLSLIEKTDGCILHIIR
jgi:hypothetical protein